MPYPQLPGHFSHDTPELRAKTVVLVLLALAVVLGVLAWRFVPRAAAPSQAQPVVQASPNSNVALYDDQQLHLAHAEQQLLVATEQLSAARRVLAGLAPTLNRNYLDNEKRRVESAWTSCDVAQRAIEGARTNINAISIKGSEQK